MPGDAGNVFSLEEIGNLAAEGGKPAETLMNVVGSDRQAFQHRRLLGLPAGAGPRQSRARGHASACAANASARCAWRVNEGLAGLVAEQVRPVAVEQVKSHPRFKYFSEAGEDAYQSFLGVPLIDRGVLQGVLVVQTVEARVFQRRRNPHADRGRRPGRARRERGAHARSLHRSRCRSACGLWPAICGGVGTTIRPACSSISTRSAGGSSITIPSRC